MPTFLKPGDIVVCVSEGPSGNNLTEGAIYQVASTSVHFGERSVSLVGRGPDAYRYEHRFRLATIDDLWPSGRQGYDRAAVLLDGSSPECPEGFEWRELPRNTNMSQFGATFWAVPRQHTLGWVSYPTSRQPEWDASAGLRYMILAAVGYASDIRPAGYVSTRPPRNIRRAVVQPLPLP